MESILLSRRNGNLPESAALIHGPVLKKLYHAYCALAHRGDQRGDQHSALQVVDVQVYTCLQVGITTKS